VKRIVEAEWLDALPAHDPGALGSRRDLDVLNRVMGHAWILRGLLESRAETEPPRRILEIGAGDGSLMLRLAKYFSPRWKHVETVLVDCKPAVSDETLAAFAALGWSAESITSDVFNWLETSDTGMADIIISNLFLHQFTEPELKRLLGLVSARTRFFAACEPRRATIPFTFSKLVGFIGCNRVTRHDAPLSVQAGFTGREISQLWPASDGWRLREHAAHFFSHAFVAEKIGS